MKVYEAVARRDGEWWSVEIPGVNGGIWTQGRTLVLAKSMAQDAIASTLDVPHDEVAVDLRVEGMAWEGNG